MLSTVTMPNRQESTNRKADATLIAQDVIERAARRSRPQSLFVFSDGSTRIMDSDGGSAYAASKRDPEAFVGTYDEDAKADDIVDDIYAAARVH